MKSKKIIRVMWALLFGNFIFCMVSCDKSSAPDVTTKEVTEITTNSARSGGIINDDHGEPIIKKGVVWNTEGNPTYVENEGRTDDGDGMDEFSSIITNLTSETTYYVRAYAISSEGTGYGDELMFETLESDPKVFDIDGNAYHTVAIGNQEWLLENLRVTRYNNGDTIPTGLSNAEWENTTEGAYAIYPHMGGITEDDVEGINSDSEMVAVYGLLYNWFAVNDSRGLCPQGWSVPSEDDWTTLINYVVSQGFLNDEDDPNGAGNAIKSCRQKQSPLGGVCNTSEHPRWGSHDLHYGTDEFGFSAVPGGARNANGDFAKNGLVGAWWSSSETSPTGAWGYPIRYRLGNVGKINYNKSLGESIRCIRYID